MRRLLAGLFRNPATLTFIRAFGASAAALYLAATQDFRLSVLWAAVMIGFAFFVAWFLTSFFDLEARFPLLRAFLLPAETKRAQPARTIDEWQEQNDKWHRRRVEHMLRRAHYGWAILLTPAEDGFVCVPLLMAGINPVSAAVAGCVFGFMHLGSYMYSECIGKAVFYFAACWLVLPHGFLTVVAGHFAMDVLGLVALLAMQRRLKAKV